MQVWQTDGVGSILVCVFGSLIETYLDFLRLRYVLEGLHNPSQANVSGSSTVLLCVSSIIAFLVHCTGAFIHSRWFC